MLDGNSETISVFSFNTEERDREKEKEYFNFIEF